MAIRRMRTINEIIKYIKKEDKDSSINRHIIEDLILLKKVYYFKHGNTYHVDLDDCLAELNLIRKDKNICR